MHGTDDNACERFEFYEHLRVMFLCPTLAVHYYTIVSCHHFFPAVGTINSTDSSQFTILKQLLMLLQ